MELHDDRDRVVDPPAEMLGGGCGLAVDQVEPALVVEATELRVRLRQPVRVIEEAGRVGEDVPDACHLLAGLALGVPRGDHSDLVAGADEPLREVARVVLHASNAVLGHDSRDDADPHVSPRTAARTIRRSLIIRTLRWRGC